MGERKLTRREFGALVGGAALASAAAGPAHPGVVGTATLVADESGRVAGAAARSAVEAALVATSGAEDAVVAVRRLFRPTDVVGIKLNCLGGRRMSPRPEVVGAFVDLLVAGGVKPRNVILFERSSRELERAGFEIQRGADRPQCYGIDNDFERTPSESGEIGSCFARLVSRTCTALVSFGVVKDHDLAGVSGGLKNWYGVIHNPNKYHDNQCDPYVADVVRHSYIRSKLRLTVLDGATAQCHGGPAFRASGAFALGKIAVSTDPVAADVWTWNVIDAERRRRGMPSLEGAGRPPRFLATAERYGLGVGDRKKLVEIEA